MYIVGYLIRVVVVALILCAVFPQDAFAYLDPATGSLIWQAIAATVLGFLVTIKLYWRRFLSFFRKIGGSSQEAPSLDQSTDEQAATESDS